MPEPRPGAGTAPPAFAAAGLDALPPVDVARRAAAVGEAKVALPRLSVFVLAVLAGAFISLGAVFATTVLAGGSDLPFGVARLLGGLAFSLGLILVVVAGAELFTGNNLVVMAWASRRVTTARLLENWALVYAGNFVGALGTVLLVFLGRQYELGGGEVGVTAVRIAEAKTSLDFVQAVALGALCNALVCLAVWLSYGARTVADKILAIVPPITAFVAAGFEHSIANMYFIPMGLLVERELEVTGIEREHLTVEAFLLDNLVPVTIGNVIGGAVMVGAVYWLVYLREPRR